ncbi:MAG: Holliday junction resolvase RuvX [Wenzhouxiangellaceae bacterium]|nr:Holliday junction resolvase RuvX [Wenzhouxiangellaceae bacterium]
MPEAGGAVLGVDYGQRRVGLATGHPLTGSAQPLRTIEHSGDPSDELDAVVREWRPARIVVGLPLAADGSESDMSREVRRFADDLRKRHPGIPVDFHDERFSSAAVDRRFAEARAAGRARRRDARNLDAHAAAVILESWLAEHPAP